MTGTQTDLGEILQRIDAGNAVPLWRHLANLFPPEPKSQAQPTVWRYRELRQCLLDVSTHMTVDEADRRVLMLVNPGLTERCATVNTLFAGLQMIHAGETAPAHRHTASAFRFIIEGWGATTTVNGESTSMNPGDLVLTPGWCWHDHTQPGDDTMVWLDGLDFPLVNLLECQFFEPFRQRTQPVVGGLDRCARQYTHGVLRPVPTPTGSSFSPVSCYPWAQTRSALDAVAFDPVGSDVDGTLFEYTNPLTGGPVMPTMSCRIQRLAPGFLGQAHRHTASAIYHVVVGEGTTYVGDTALEWGRGDVFAVPGWAPHQHANAFNDHEAVLFSFTDEPLQRSLGIHRATDVEPIA